MALPKVKHPTYKAKIPSTKNNISFRPFTVQEEKLLLMASNSDDTENIVDSIKQIINNCILDDVDVSKLASFDIEYIFLKLRSKSVGEVVTLIYTDDEEGKVEYEINLDDVEMKYNSDHKNKFIIHDKVGVVMRYPTLDEVKKLSVDDIDTVTEEETDKLFNVLIGCIESVYDDEELYTDFTLEELNEFIMSMPIDAMKKMQHFFETMPSLEYTKEITLPSGKKKEITLKGLTSFFTY